MRIVLSEENQVLTDETLVGIIKVIKLKEEKEETEETPNCSLCKWSLTDDPIQKFCAAQGYKSLAVIYNSVECLKLFEKKI